MRKNIIYILFIIILAIPLYNCSKTDPASIDLSGKWNIIYSDEKFNADPAYDITDTGQIDIPGDWNHFLAKNDHMSATIWLRKEVTIGGEFINSQLVLSPGKIGIADETYFNGTLIGYSGRIPDSEKLNYQIAWKIPRHYLIPKELIKFDGKNYIAIRIFSHVFNGITGNPGIFKLNNGEPYQFTFDFTQLLLNFAGISFNFLFLLIFLVLYITNRSNKIYIHIASISLFGFAFNLCFIRLPFQLNGLIRFKIIVLSYFLINYFILLAFKEYFKFRRRIINAVNIFLATSISLLILVSPSTKILINYCGSVSIISALLWLLYIQLIILISIIKDPRRNWKWLLLLPMTVSFYRNIYYLITKQFNMVPWLIFIHIPVFMFAIILFFFYDYEYEKKASASLFRALQNKTRKLQSTVDSASEGRYKKGPREVVHTLIEYLDNNFIEPYNRIELSEKFGLNENYMVQIFKKTTNTTISTYINNKRIEYAKMLLEETETQIIDIAYQIGFDNYSYFYKLFRECTGQTPKEYRISSAHSQEKKSKESFTSS